MKNSIIQLGIVSGSVDLFKTTSNFYIAHKTSYENNAVQRLLNDTKKFKCSKQVRLILTKEMAPGSRPATRSLAGMTNCDIVSMGEITNYLHFREV